MGAAGIFSMEGDRDSNRRPVVCRLTALIFCLFCAHHTEAQYAKGSYFLDASSDCYIPGYLLIRTEEVVNIASRKPGSSKSDILRCTVRFKPDDDRDIIDVSFTHMTISDKGVTLRVDLAGAGSYTLRAGDPTPQKLTATGAQATVSLSRLSLEDREYSFSIIVRVYKEDKTLVDKDEKPVGVGLVVGIIAGVIIFLVFLAVLIVCCFRRKRDHYRGRSPDDPKVDLATSNPSPPRKFGLENAARNGNHRPNEEEESPPVKKKPPQRGRGREDLSDSGSDSREEEVMRKSNGSPGRLGAGVRYENERNRVLRDPPPPSERNRPYNEQPERNRSYRDQPERNRSYRDQPEGNRSYRDQPEGNRSYRDQPEGNRSYRDQPERNRSDTDQPNERNRSFNKQPERNRPYREEPERNRPFIDELNERNRPHREQPERNRPLIDELNERNRPHREQPERNRPFIDELNERNRSYNKEPAGMRRRPEIADDDDRHPENEQPQRQGVPPKSPILTALKSNLRFRASFHAAEQEAEDRARKIGGGGRDDAANDSDVSMTETWNTTFDTNFDDDPRPPAGSFIKPPTLAPVPMSPREPVVRRENVASIRRAPRPSSSSSEVEQGEGRMQQRGVSRNPPPPSPGEIVPIRVQDPHSPSIKRKANAQRNSPHPTQDGSVQDPSSADSQNSEPPPPLPKPKPKKSTPNKPKPEKNPKKPKKPVEPADEAGSRPREGKGKPKEGRTEYEGRFKKSDSVRKSKSKSPRLGRSRSTGTVLEDTDSVGQPTTPRGNRAVPQVTADDYEDSDAESNYNPLRRTGSKNSLYTSRSSLYARRRRKNSLGESVYSLAFDDLDSERPKRDSFKERSLSRRDRGFRSLGDLEMELRDQETRSTQAGLANMSPGKKTVAKKSKPRSVSSSQTSKSKQPRNLDSSSSSSGVTKPRERKNSASSTSARSKSTRDGASSVSSVSVKGKSRKNNSGAKSDEEGALDRRRPASRRGKPKPKPKPGARGKSRGER
ncbi:hypothetical protein ACOMHN_033751 [Nucella lapillus]